MEEEILTILEKQNMMCDLDYDNHEEFEYKINTELMQRNLPDESYRELLVSFFQMAPLIKKTVRLEEADYIVYANPFARIEDFTLAVLDDLEFLESKRKKDLK